MGENYGWIELVFFYGFALSFALWQYWSVSRDLKRTKEERAKAEAEAEAQSEAGPASHENPEDEKDAA